MPVEIEPAAPSIVSSLAGGAAIGETVGLSVANAADTLSAGEKPRVSVQLGGVEHLASLQGETVQFTVLPTVPEGPQPLIVTINGRYSPASTITVRAR
jgi:hypothetical protein